ncbi:MAG TPA: HAD family phosphatase [Verrucomicrobiota bacterium]|nr:HAD family phosphatase [Verrucomicrobiota bacterium]HNU50867.1 HAD family phosphatase [Verrucomicrobiota bacterium]
MNDACEDVRSGPEPRVVVFDLGKVLLDFDYGIAVRRLLPRMRLSLDQLQGYLTEGSVLGEYESGQLTTAEFFERARVLTGYDGSMDSFDEAFADIFSEIPPMVALQAGLRKGGWRTYILSNTNELAIRHIRRRFPFFAGFDGYVLSYEHQALKPGPRLYEVTEGMTGCRGSELFYLDDRPENVAAARARGWQAVVHESYEASRAAARAAGLPV